MIHLLRKLFSKSNGESDKSYISHKEIKITNCYLEFILLLINTESHKYSNIQYNKCQNNITTYLLQSFHENNKSKRPFKDLKFLYDKTK